MDVILTDSAIRMFLDTSASAETISHNLCLCGPTVDRLQQSDDDYIYQIEAITNRVDTVSAFGIAREACAILKQVGISATLTENPYLNTLNFPQNQTTQFNFNIDSDLALRFMAISIENISIKPSPETIQKLLNRCQQKPINNCVDITNELTILYGMPSHIFDLDKLSSHQLHLRVAKNGESLTTLDGKTHQLIGDEIIIEDGRGKIVDLCGIMGGQIAEVDQHTKNILLVVPVYEPHRIRKASLHHQTRTLAAQIYEKQPDPEICPFVMSKALSLIQERAGGKASSSLFDFHPNPKPPKKVSIDLVWLKAFVGLDLSADTAIFILQNLGFQTSIDTTKIEVTVPSWRYHDINIREDLAEEISRIFGYFRIPPSIPQTGISPEENNPLLGLEIKIKKHLSSVGFTEIYNSSLVSLELLSKTLQDPRSNLRLTNSLSKEYEFLRTTLIPSAIENYKHNLGKTNITIETFEIANCYHHSSDTLLPEERSTLAILSPNQYRKIKGQLEHLFQKLNIKDPSFTPDTNCPQYFHPNATARILSSNKFLGHIGLVNPTVSSNLGLNEKLTAIEINLAQLIDATDKKSKINLISDYPSIVDDITIESNLPIAEIMAIIRKVSPLIEDIKYLQSYNNKHSFQVSFNNPKKNLTQSEIDILKPRIHSLFTKK